MTMVSAREWKLRVVATYWLDAGPRAENAWHQRLPENAKLPRSVSLKSKTEITELLREGRYLAGELASIKWKESDQFRFAILLSKRHGSAVKRNRIKRLFREAIRLSQHTLQGKVRFVLLPGKEMRLPEYAQIRDEISSLFHRISKKLQSDWVYSGSSSHCPDLSL